MVRIIAKMKPGASALSQSYDNEEGKQYRQRYQ